MSIAHRQVSAHIRKLADGEFTVPLLITTKNVGICTLEDLGFEGDSLELIKQAAIASIAAAGTHVASSPEVTMQGPPDASGNDGATAHSDDHDTSQADIDMDGPKN